MNIHGIVCRKANISDQKFIDDMSKGMYSGIDFTPKIFQVWLSDENWQPFVAEQLELKTPEGYEAKHDFEFIVVRCGNRNPDIKCHCCLLCSNGSTDKDDQPHNALASLTISHESFSSLCETKKSIIQELLPSNIVFIGQAMHRLDLKENREFLDKQKYLVAGCSGDQDYIVLSIVDLRQRESVNGYKVYYVDLYGNNSAMILQHALKAISMASKQADGKVFDMFIHMHSKEAEAIVCHFRNCKIYDVIFNVHMKITEADIDIAISNMLKKFQNN
eukprot:gene62-658_t